MKSSEVSREGVTRIARCSCGKVVIEAFGDPITSTVCYCDTCQEGSRQIEALPNAAPIRGPDGGTAYILYRKDRIKYSQGTELLKGYKIDEKSPTRRSVATCCNSAMVMQLDDVMHWVPIYRGRFHGEVPPLQYRICTKFKPANAEIPNDVPVSKMYPPGLMLRLLISKIAMVLGK
jgi:hypothetical protein